jgi:HK97 family phage portal protein
MNTKKPLVQRIADNVFGARETSEAKSLTTAEVTPRHQQGRPIRKNWDSAAAIRNSFEKSTWVYSAVSRRMNAVASANWYARAKNSQGEWQKVDDSPIANLINRPNDQISKQTMMQRMVVNLDLGGNELWSKVRSDRKGPNGRGIMVELWPMDIGITTPVAGVEELIAYYQVKGQGVNQKILAEDMVHFMFTDPSNPRWGLAPLKAASMTVDTDIEAVRWNKLALQNRAVADGAWTFNAPLTIEQYNDAKKQIREQHQGSTNAREPWVVGGDAKWEQFSMTPVEMDFIESQKLTRETICSSLGVPPPLVGIYENATLSNIQVAREIFWVDTAIPLLDDIKDSLNLALVPEFGDPGELELCYDISHIDVISNMLLNKAEAAERLFKMGVPFNMVNERLNLGFDTVPGGDVGFVPANVVPSVDIGGGDGQGSSSEL